jgi:hypothetical protein
MNDLKLPSYLLQHYPFSNTHSKFSEKINDPKILWYPQYYLGPNYQSVIDFWKYIDTLTEKQWDEVEIRFNNFSERRRMLSAADAALDDAIGTNNLSAAKLLTWLNSRKAAESVSWNTRQEAENNAKEVADAVFVDYPCSNVNPSPINNVNDQYDALLQSSYGYNPANSCWSSLTLPVTSAVVAASCELIGRHILENRGQQLVFFPMFDNLDTPSTDTTPLD